MYNTLWQPQTFGKLKGTNKQYDPNIIIIIVVMHAQTSWDILQHLSNLSVHQNKDLLCVFLDSYAHDLKTAEV